MTPLLALHGANTKIREEERKMRLISALQFKFSAVHQNNFLMLAIIRAGISSIIALFCFTMCHAHENSTNSKYDNSSHLQILQHYIKRIV
jgi:hypothetical protein